MQLESQSPEDKDANKRTSNLILQQRCIMGNYTACQLYNVNYQISATVTLNFLFQVKISPGKVNVILKSDTNKDEKQPIFHST